MTPVREREEDMTVSLWKKKGTYHRDTSNNDLYLPFVVSSPNTTKYNKSHSPLFNLLVSQKLRI